MYIKQNLCKIMYCVKYVPLLKLSGLSHRQSLLREVTAYLFYADCNDVFNFWCLLNTCTIGNKS